jgi:hypothetical protein
VGWRLFSKAQAQYTLLQQPSLFTFNYLKFKSQNFLTVSPCLTLKQRRANSPKIHKPLQNSTRQKGEMNEVPFWWPPKYQTSRAPFSRKLYANTELETMKKETLLAKYSGIFSGLTFIPLEWRIWWARDNTSKWHLGFNSAFKGSTEEKQKKFQDMLADIPIKNPGPPE